MDQYEVVRQVGQGAFGRALLVKQRHGDAQLYVIKEINLRQFEGSNLRQLVLRICRGRYSPVSQRYSSDLRLLLQQLFKVSPRDRPSANSLLKRPMLQQQISKHLDAQHRKPDVPAVEKRFAFRPGVVHERRWMSPVEPPQEPDHDEHRPADLEPYRLDMWSLGCVLYELCTLRHPGLSPSTADADRRQSNPQEHHGNVRAAQDRRLQGQEGLRPSTADADRRQSNPQEHHGNVRAAQDRRLQGQEERVMAGTHVLKKNRERRTHGKQQQRGIMFEIKLSDEETPQNADIKNEEDEESEDEPLNNTLTFAQGGNLRNQPHRSEARQEVEEEVVKRAEWHREKAETLLNALENMDVMTESSIISEEQDGGNRKHWTDRLPETLLNALAQANIMDCSTETLMSSEEKRLAEDECDEDDDVEVDEERLEPRSDDEDTNFEESEDELREEVSDSMRNLLTTQELQEEQEEHAATDGQEEVSDSMRNLLISREQQEEQTQETQEEVKIRSEEECEETQPPASITAHHESEENTAVN
ncbi:Serine threonine- kinase [Labeo rohita]|uniref:Serine threonine-kinase n=1 Tax=Labeo rohita TaxID=84645 RepID=A0A498M9H9_LABRO|nr:Serine threonine- kinase [Labeo rohita]